MKIVSNLTIGLGNQLFQYAAAFAYAKKLGGSLHYDSSTNLGCPQQHNEIRKLFRLSASEYKPPSCLGSYLFFLSRRVLAYLRSLNLLRYMSNAVFVEKSFAYEDQVSNKRVKDTVYLVGYFQAIEYFIDYTDELRSELQFDIPISKKSEVLSKKILATNSVSIHVRRGDYMSASANKVHGTCDLEYYEAAMSYIRENVDSPVFYVFSDDIKWCIENLMTPPGAVFSDVDSDPFDDFQLMTLCKSNIIANSTFSWWSAFLNKNENKIVIAPKKWFSDNKLDSIAQKQLYLNEWVKI